MNARPVRSSLLILLMPLLWLLAAPPATAFDEEETEWVTETGDILQIALPVIGGLSTLFTNPDPDKKWDREGTKQFALAYGSAWATTYTLKLIASKARPNGNNRTSFPSGHTMSAFAGAAFIDSRYGKAVGIPSYALAVFTGYSRVQSNWHYQDDVLAGASIGMLYAWNFVSPQPGKMALLPTVSEQGLGMVARVGGGTEEARPIDPSLRGASYDFGFGPAYQVTNVSASRGDGGNEFQLTDLDGNNDPTTTAVVTVAFPVSQRGRVHIGYGPFEARDTGAFSYDVSFGGQEFPAGTPINSAWRYYDLYAAYQHAFVAGDRWQLGLGAGAGIMYSYTGLQAQDGSAEVVVDDEALYPYGIASLGYYFSDRIGIEARGEGMALGDNYLYTLVGDVVWRAAHAWDFRAGFTYFGRKIESDAYYNKVRYGIPTWRSRASGSGRSDGRMDGVDPIGERRRPRLQDGLGRDLDDLVRPDTRCAAGSISFVCAVLGRWCMDG